MRTLEARHLICLVYPATVAAGIWLGGWATWASFLLGGSLYPLLDAIRLAPVQTRDPVEAPSSGEAFLAGFALIEFVLLGWAAMMIVTHDYTPWELAGIALSLGTLTGGIGIPAAHELIHKRDRRLRALGLLLLAPMLYMHFRVEHVYGHHSRVGTPADPATARRGEGLWRFVARSVGGQFASAYRIEERLRSTAGEGRRRTNRVIVYAVLELALLVSVALLLGAEVLAVFVGQAVAGIIFLEATNYIEHYGLQRRLLPNGRHEPVSILHSWNSPSFFTNSLAFNLALHSDHHANPQRAFPSLRHQPSAPQLPAGYLAMIAVAAVPPLWRRIMEPRLRAFENAARPEQIHAGASTAPGPCQTGRS